MSTRTTKTTRTQSHREQRTARERRQARMRKVLAGLVAFTLVATLAIPFLSTF